MNVNYGKKTGHNLYILPHVFLKKLWKETKIANLYNNIYLEFVLTWQIIYVIINKLTQREHKEHHQKHPDGWKILREKVLDKCPSE